VGITAVVRRTFRARHLGLLGNRIETAGAERMTAGEPSGGKPRAARDAMPNDGVPGEV
jgi:hypothetical protein